LRLHWNPFDSKAIQIHANSESGRVLAALAADEGWQLLDEKPSLLNDALVAVSCREQGITLITKDGDFKRLSPFVRGFHYAAPWPAKPGR
jgi:predicted nucleic acid-binding protein